MHTTTKPRTKNNIHVLFFEGDLRDGTIITAFCENTNKFSQEPYAEVDINVNEFKSWAQQEEAFDWCMDYNDPSKQDGHGQLTGTMSWDEYCDLPNDALCHDLAKFLHQRPLKK